MGVGMSVNTPGGGQTMVVFGSRGVDSIQDAMGYTTAFTYVDLAAGWTLTDSIAFSSGLQSKFEYTMLPARDEKGKSFAISACSSHIHQDAVSNTVSDTEYQYGADTGYANYTGASIGCTMKSSKDSLMECRNQKFRYYVTITRLDADKRILQMSRVYYNYLHLSMAEDHYNIDANGNPFPSYRTENEYDLPTEFHARSTMYNLPVQADQLHYCQSKYQLHRRATSTYDEYGCPLSTIEWMWDKEKNDLKMQKSITSTYATTSWGGQLPNTEVLVDHVNRNKKHIAYKLTSDQRSIANSTVMYREKGTARWKAWKEKSYSYDSVGRVTTETIAWSAGADFPTKSVEKYTYKKVYSFDSETGINTETTTDLLGNVGKLRYGMRTKGGPLMKKVSPLGSRETLKYDLSSRLVETTDSLGSTIETSYSLGPGRNFVQNVTSMGYITRMTYDSLSRAVEIMDCGNQGSTEANRILSRSDYDAVSRVVKSVNELGIVTTTQAHDELTMALTVNGNLLSRTFSDGLGRQTKIVTYGDSENPNNSYTLVTEQVYDGFGKVTSSRRSQKSLNGSTSTLLAQTDVCYDVQDKPYNITFSALPSTLLGGTDNVTREIQFDIFGNAVTYKKSVSYADGRNFVHNGPLSVFDAGSRMVQLINQLGHAEVNEFDADGRLKAMTRYDGAKHTYTYDKLGQILSSTGPDGPAVYEYLPNGRLASITRGVATIKHTYTADGSVKSTQYPDGRAQTYVLDDFSRVIKEVDCHHPRSCYESRDLSSLVR
ncbi:hypothetical protein G7Y89_g12816 [Cudoniella acicularis]|uniref:Uncharacterized protein n=1 Tax=Cudoniella acicularis TaxID=354080 RepID=A0A8H4R9P1_9HELO|nr:hypothetical protein G7Y89_g12816 [Cudoniella acicularis]